MKKDKAMNRVMMLLAVLFLAVGTILTGCKKEPFWFVSRKEDILEIFYFKDGKFLQFGALHTNSGYFRLNYGEGSGWGHRSS